MNQLITPRQAWWFTGVSAVAGIGWCLWAIFAWRLPLHPWSSIPAAVAVFIAMYAWSAVRPATLQLLHKAIGYWNLAVLAAVILAAVFGPPKQPFPQFALDIILKAAAVLLATVVGCGLMNLCRHVFRGDQRQTQEL